MTSSSVSYWMIIVGAVNEDRKPDQVSHVKAILRFYDGFLALAISFSAQLLITAIWYALEHLQCPFPPAILAMIGVFGLLSALGLVWNGLEHFYQKHLRNATDLLNRHMSIGFTIPFLMVCRNPVANGQTIGLIIASFFLTGVLNTLAAYFFAYNFQKVLLRYTVYPKTRCVPDTELGMLQTYQDGIWNEDRAKKTVSEVSSMLSNLGNGSTSSCENGCLLEEHNHASNVSNSKGEKDMDHVSLRHRVRDWVLMHPFMILCWSITFAAGIPLRLLGINATVLDTFFLFSIWLSMLALHTGVRSCQLTPRWVRVLLAGVFNAVLWTSLFMMVYVFAERECSGQATPHILDRLQTNTTFSAFVISHSSSSNTSSFEFNSNTSPSIIPTMGAGDVALAILNAGLVSWGFKLYEYRWKLFSRAGLTVFVISSLTALGNVLFGPLVAQAVGLRPASRELSFAARSVTLALGSPVVTQLGGDLSLNAAMVVISGILYQMGLGFGIGVWLEKTAGDFNQWSRRTWTAVRRDRGSGKRDVAVALAQASSPGPDPADQRVGSRSPETPVIRVAIATEARPQTRPQGQLSPREQMQTQFGSPRTVAAGITVGINSAAMGTAHLYEVKSDAAPFSALSMTILGIMTVVFCTIQPIAHWITDQVNRG